MQKLKRFRGDKNLGVFGLSKVIEILNSFINKPMHTRGIILSIEFEFMVIWWGEEDVIRDHILNFYKELFAETEKWRSKWSDEELIKISEEEKIWLEEPFTSEEVEAVVKMFEGDKAPGPDGFNMYFFQECWNTVKEDVMKTVETFWQEGTFVSSLNATFITLIPKKKGAEEIKDFRPITLLGSVYNIIIVG